MRRLILEQAVYLWGVSERIKGPIKAMETCFNCTQRPQRLKGSKIAFVQKMKSLTSRVCYKKASMLTKSGLSIPHWYVSLKNSKYTNTYA
jgi:hypothetical protein